MEWKDVGNAVKVAAPLVGTALGGPVGGAIGGLVSLIASAFGIGDAEATPEKIMGMIQQDPQALIKLREIESNHRLELERIVLEQDRMFYADIASARSREIETTKATGTRDVNLYVLAWMVVLLFFCLVYVLTFQELPDANIGPVNQLYGVMGTGFGVVLAYFFGSSKGSAEKNALMDRALIKDGK